MRIIVFLCTVLMAGSVWAECKELVFSGAPETPPFIWETKADSVRIVGALVEFAHQSLAQEGIQAKAININSWARAQVELKEGGLDLIYGLFYTEERAQSVHYLEPPITYSRARVWMNQNKTFALNTISDLTRYSGATVNDFSFGQEFDQYAQQHLQLLRLNSIEQAYKMLSAGRVDYLVYEEVPGQLYQQQLNDPNLQMHDLVLMEIPVYLAFSKQSKCYTAQSVAVLEKSLRESTEQGLLGQLTEDAMKLWIETR